MGASPKASKLRCHIDLRTSDPVAEIERLLRLGARRADVGQRGDEGFDVLADPEGNEFCLLHRSTPTTPGRARLTNVLRPTLEPSIPTACPQAGDLGREVG